MKIQDLKSKIREIPDFPQPGILFYDITTLLKEPEAFRRVIDQFVRSFRDEKIRKVVGIESRGFILGAPVAYRLGAGFVPVRRPGKLPADVYEAHYSLEYGKNSLTIHRDAIAPGERVLIVDDLLATGGTLEATIDLVTQLKGVVVGVACVIELVALKGREKVKGHPVLSLLTY